MRTLLSRIALLTIPFFLAGCRDEKVTTYKVPKEKEPAAHSANDGHDHGAAASASTQAPAPVPAGNAGDGAMANTPVATTSGNALAWTAPSHWQSVQGSSMRKATFSISGDGEARAELAVTAFPGDVGGEIANVNRWRGQIQLGPQPESEVKSSIQRIEANGLQIGVVDIVNPSATPPIRVLGAMVPHEGATWFFKLTGPDALVAKEKTAFLEFLNTVKPARK